MRTLKWSRPALQVGAAAAASALSFALGAAFSGIWAAIFAATVPVAFFLGFLGREIFGRARPKGEISLAAGTLGLLAILFLTNGYHAFQRAEYKKNLLVGVIRSSVDRGVLTKQVGFPLLKTLGAYYGRPAGPDSLGAVSKTGSAEGKAGESLRDVFERRRGKYLKRDKGLVEYVPPALEDRPFPAVYYDSTGGPGGSGDLRPKEKAVVLIGRSAAGNGQDSSFDGYDGRKGHLQVELILTPRGLSYDRAN
ncbi:hypothetical protein [Salinibacter ruber]|jgi:hypothetical protein|uniref:Uncharacterized protein n=2 Tax=Salinibacter ruber TaxID=146919 RepID=A0A9X2UQC8_9BACT|nr:hypothetical protein [Salinibacter ruber]MCS3616954.1 hypothetical protein [Salinibacter ruber]MCS4038343.1 hypothetical protein [Salinibacter ruber]MCS4198458.1 hypothetical protein [Salinibacter ruber]